MNDTMLSLSKVYKLSEITNKKLTLISNINKFRERIDIMIKSSKGGVLLFIDSDKFSAIDDILDEYYGDIRLRKISKTLESYMDNKGILYRINESKYMLYIYNIDTTEHYLYKLEKKLKNICKSIELEESNIYSSVNIGISIYPNHGDTSIELINNAKIAMYKSKELGKNKYHFFQYYIYEEMIEKKEMKDCLRNALKNNEFILHYQPQIDISTNKIYGVEALLRWNSKRYGYMTPDKFIPLAEETGFIVDIGYWILKDACIQANKWKDYGLNIKTSVNISAIQLQDRSFLDNVKKIIAETNVDPSLIGFEITESILIKYTKKAQEILTEIKNMGIKILLDDFGTGYSSLTYLNRFPIDTIKIDKSFIQDLSISPQKKAIIDGIIYMAQNMGIDVTAEGIESKKELDLLKEKKCNIGQGYIYSKPLPINELEKFFEEFAQNVIGL